jgi:hypothetical protein
LKYPVSQAVQNWLDARRATVRQAHRDNGGY